VLCYEYRTDTPVLKSGRPAGESVAVGSCPCYEAYITVEPNVLTKQMRDCWAPGLSLESDRGLGADVVA
jgi:hypothetical protein